MILEDDSTLEKIAQRRSVLQWLHEKANVPRQFAEGLSGVYGDQMDQLREIDTLIRYEARHLKNDLKDAKNSLKQRRYLDVVHFIANINDAIKNIVGPTKELIDTRKKNIGDFFGESQHFDPKRKYFDSKTAGILDAFKGKSREYAGRVLEKMYYNSMKEQKRALISLVNAATSLVDFTFETLKDLGTARARGDVSNYIKLSNRLDERRKAFENMFRKTYEEYIVPLVKEEKKEEEQKQEEVKQPEQEQMVASEQEISPEEPMTVEINAEEPEIEVDEKDLEPEQLQMFASFVEHGNIKKIASSFKRPEDVEKFALYCLNMSKELDLRGDYKKSLQYLAMAEGLLDA